MARPGVSSFATRRFWNLLQALPSEIQTLALKNYRLWLQDPNHPSLHFRCLKGGQNSYTVRIGDHYRALGQLTGTTMTWVWIGSHSDYNRLVGSD